MNSKLKILLLAAGCWLLVALSACNEPAQQDATSGPPDMIRRAQLVGQENIQLKKQIETLKAEIAELKQRVKELDQEKLTISRQQDEVYANLMKLWVECQKKLEIYEPVDISEAFNLLLPSKQPENSEND